MSEAKIVTLFSIAFLREAFYTCAEPETEAWKLVECQLILFSGDLKSDKREQ